MVNYTIFFVSEVYDAKGDFGDSDGEGAIGADGEGLKVR